MDDDSVLRGQAPAPHRRDRCRCSGTRTSGKRARMAGSTSRANHITASTLGGWRKPPTKTRSLRWAKGWPGPATWCRLETTSTTRARRFVRQPFLLHGADHQGGVRARHHRQFRGAGGFGRAQHRLVPVHFRAAPFAQVMQVDGVEHHFRLRRMPSRPAAGMRWPRSAGRARRHRIARRARASHAGGNCAMRCIPGLHAELLQGFGVSAGMVGGWRDEHTCAPSSRSSRIRLTRRSDPESRSGCGVSASMISTWRCAGMQHHGRGRLPGAGCSLQRQLPFHGEFPPLRSGRP